MPPTSRPAAAEARAAAVANRPHPVVLCVVAWLVPGAGHLFVGKLQKSVIFFVVLTAMFTIGLAFGGRLFPFQTSEILAALAGLAEWLIGLPRIIGALAGFGQGEVTAITYEYGNTFLIVSGLLNALVVLDAYDVLVGRKP